MDPSFRDIEIMEAVQEPRELNVTGGVVGRCEEFVPSSGPVFTGSLTGVVREAINLENVKMKNF